MYAGVAGLKYYLPHKFAIYGRGEFFYDANGIMTGVITETNGTLSGYKLWGTTLGLERIDPTENRLRAA